MKKVVLVFGVIAGLILAASGFALMYLCVEGTMSMDSGMVVGYTTMAISLSMIFFGIKSYRDNYSNGTITFWKGLQIGLLITLISSVFYFGGAAIYSQTHPGFIEKMTTKLVESEGDRLRRNGASQEEIDAGVAHMVSMIKAMENPVLFYLICLMELSPVGIIISLVSAAILRKKEVLPRTPVAV